MIRGERDETSNSWLTVVGAAAFSPTVILISSANSVIVSNVSDLSYSPRLVLLSISLFVLLTGLSVPLFRSASSSALARLSSHFLVMTGFCVLACGVANALFERSTASLSLIALVDIGLITMVAIVAFQVPTRPLYAAAGAIGASLLVYATLSHAGALQVAWRDDAAREQRIIPRPAQVLPVGNVYHIVLDGFQREVYEVLAQQEVPHQLPGFVFYPRFTSAYGKTRQSLPNLLTGRTLGKGESLMEWQVEATSRGLWGDLAKGGMATTFYPYFQDECPTFSEDCFPAMAIDLPSEENSGIGRPLSNAERQLVDSWFLLLVPRSASLAMAPPVSEAINGSKDERLRFREKLSITALLQGKSRVTERVSDVPNPVPTDSRPAASVYNFRQMLADEAARPGRGQYVFAHAHLPHGPFKLDKNCLPSNQEKSFVQSILDQSACGLKLVEELVQKLEELDRLDDALIIVHGDHGAFVAVIAALALEYPVPFRPNTTYVAPTSRNDPHPPASASAEMVPLRSGALLLVKNSGTKRFGTSEIEVQMIDLAPTILSFVGLEIDEYVGFPLDNFPTDLRRDRQYFQYEGTSFVPWGRRVFFDVNGERPSIIQKAMLGGRKPRMHSFVQDAAGWHYQGAFPINY